MFIQGSLLNARSISTEDFVKHVAGQAADCHYFIVEPPPGITMSASVDWRVVVPSSTAVAPLAAALWSGFETFVMPLRTKQSNAGIFVQCKNAKGQFDQFTIGIHLNDKKAVAQRLEDACRLLSPKHTENAVRQILKDTEQSGFWEKLI